MKTAEKIVYFAGCAVNYIEPGVGKATVQVLRETGFTPIFPDQKCCAIPKLANGDVNGFMHVLSADFQSKGNIILYAAVGKQTEVLKHHAQLVTA